MKFYDCEVLFCVSGQKLNGRLLLAAFVRLLPNNKRSYKCIRTYVLMGVCIKPCAFCCCCNIFIRLTVAATFSTAAAGLLSSMRPYRCNTSCCCFKSFRILLVASSQVFSRFLWPAAKRFRLFRKQFFGILRCSLVALWFYAKKMEKL